MSDEEPKASGGAKGTGRRAGAASPGKGAAKRSGSAASGKPSLDPRLIQAGAAALAGLVIGLLLGALLFGGGDDGDEGLTAATDEPPSRLVTPTQLAREARSLGRPVYWAGPSGSDSIELERSPEGNVSVRYIPGGTDSEGEAADFLTVVTYPYPEARKALEQQAASGDLLSRKLPKGGFVISQPDQPTNAYLAYAGEDYQVEIYDPRPGRALQLAVDGSITPAG